MKTRRPWRLLAPGNSFVLPQGALRVVGAGLASAALIGLSGCSSDTSMAGMDHSTDSASPGASASSGDSMADMNHSDGHDHMHMGDTIGDATEASLEGFTLDAIDTNASAENEGRLTFRITKENGAPLINFMVHHEKPMHLFLYNSDLSRFFHVHPTMNGAGTWLVELPPMPAGTIHMAANFAGTDDAGESKQVMLGGDFEVAGTASAEALPKPAAAVMVDGYRVSLDDGLQAGTEAKMTVRITKAGKPAALVPYFGAWAHVAAIDSSTLAASHLHPAQEWEEGAASPDVLTVLYTPAAAGTERIFIEFATDEGYHRAEFTRQVG